MKINDAVEAICTREPFFTHLIKQLKVVKDDKCPTMGTDGDSLFYNQDFVDSISEAELSGVMLHETLHCAFLHMWRREDRHPLLFNIAADYAINGIVLENFPLPAGCLHKKEYDGLSAEEIYDKLEQDAKQQAWGDHSRWDCGEDGKSSMGDKIKEAFGGEKKSQKQQRIKEKWEKAFEDITRQYGKAPEMIKRHIEKGFYQPRIDWTTLISQLLTEDENDYSFSVRDRRFLESPIFLPAQNSLDKLQDVVFAFDTSGSIRDEQLRAFYMETISLFSNFISLQGWVAVCDSQLHAFNQIYNQSAFEDFKFNGGGGTNFRPVFEEVEKRSISPKALFYFTDTEGEFPPEPSYPVFWLVKDGGGSVPFGTIINF